MSKSMFDGLGGAEIMKSFKEKPLLQIIFGKKFQKR